ncbi:MAG TPA: GNAT family N-acetyltransferase, partial [Anaerolineales bacterium]
MVTQIQLAVREAVPQDRQQLANLIHFEVNVHRHLDWRPPLDWIGHPPYLVAEMNGSLVASLACPPDPPGVAWVHLFAVAGGIFPERVWNVMWPTARQQLIAGSDASWAAAIPLQGWFRSILEESEFVQAHHVVMLSWERGSLPAAEDLPGVALRRMNFDDLPVVEQIDASSFEGVWQNSQSSLEIAYQQAAVATVAEEQGRLIGYQISTATPMGGHLARLGVVPQAQGRGIGYALVRDTLSQFQRRGARNVT